ncbi:hypothetical protein H9P43_002920 [Blastocladiella emersonii ATCC 22665]|nr:hypothetical protein H9P43_002920 [Blastocladiella emersonii ATCC 22665]
MGLHAPPISTHWALALTRAKRASSNTIDHLGDARKVELPTRPGCLTRASPSVCTAEFDKRHCEHVAVIKSAKLLRDASIGASVRSSSAHVICRADSGLDLLQYLSVPGPPTP